MTDSSAESSLLLWLLAAAVAVLALHVALGWVRHAQRLSGLREQWSGLVLAAAALGTGLCGAVVLALAGEALTFPLGYRAVHAGALWLGAMGGSLVVCYASVLSQRWWALLGTGVLLAGMALGLQMGWLIAVGFRPGIVWRPEFVTAAAILLIIGCSGGLWMAFSGAGQEAPQRTLWRLGASAVLGVSVVAGQQVLSAGVGLPAQVGSIYVNQLPGSVLGLVCGVLLPLVLGVMAMDLAMRRRSGRRSSRDAGANFAPQKRRRRRHRIRSL